MHVNPPHSIRNKVITTEIRRSVRLRAIVEVDFLAARTGKNKDDDTNDDGCGNF